MLKALSSQFNRIKNVISLKYGKDPGKMLIHTGVAGWIMSSAAQIIGIVFNDKISKEQKLFMIPQEAADATVNIVSFLLVTQTFKHIASEAMRTGKWIPKNIKDFLKKRGQIKNLGTKNFNVLKRLEKAKVGRRTLSKYQNVCNGIDVVATTTGSVISCNLITPAVRNVYASHSQKEMIARMENGKQKNKKTDAAFPYYVSLSDFKNHSSSLKI